MKFTDLNDWVADTTGTDSWRTIAEKLHTTHATIKRRLTNHESDAIIEVARAYDVNPIDGLLAAGCVTEMDVKAAARTYTVDDLSDVELSQIIVDRLTERERQEARRSNVSAEDVYHLGYVADSSEDEEEGDAGDYDA